MDQKVNELDEIMKIIFKGKNFLLSGGAGSGKTYSLVKTIDMLKNQDKNVSIACITYTNVAAEMIRKRILDSSKVWVSTIHDFLWENISNYQNELKECLVELVNDESIKCKDCPIDINYFNNKDIQYKAYLKIRDGIISHDEVLKVSNKMYEKHKILSNILKDKYKFILVDEYQDTSPLVIEILLKYLNNSEKKNIIGFYGDSMQAIYDGSIGDLEDYINSGEIIEVEKKQNRRNPKKVIELANKIRMDGIQQEASDDKNAPNMNDDGTVKEGEIKFIYSNDELTIDEIKKSEIFNDWKFDDFKETKELNLTHRLIAKQCDFSEIYDIYDKDPIQSLKKKLINAMEEKRY